ncbi:MAG: YicC/YloC family endoribonuclease [Bacteroidota bacterium]
MLKSMTGYGQSSYADDKLNISVEIRTLNSKYLDINSRLPKAFSDREIALRNRINEKLERGKVNIVLDYQYEGRATPLLKYNEELFVAYYNELASLAHKVDADRGDLFRLAINSPEVLISTEDDKLAEEEWGRIMGVVDEALGKCDEFRMREGAVIAQKLSDYINQIDESLKAIEGLDQERIEVIKGRIRNNLLEFFEEEQIDKNRFEQELIYYLEKLDISEEKVRLASHLQYFHEVLSDGKSNGKKLGFISQEIGREINTIGSKCNDAAIQKHVVVMKEELEKIKEQILNIL